MDGAKERQRRCDGLKVSLRRTLAYRVGIFVLMIGVITPFT